MNLENECGEERTKIVNTLKSLKIKQSVCEREDEMIAIYCKVLVKSCFGRGLVSLDYEFF